MESSRPILCLGEVIVDLLGSPSLKPGEIPERLEPFPGGALANVAVAVARSGAPAAMAGGVGRDDWGGWLAEGLEREGVSTEWLARLQGVHTPVSIVIFGPDDEPRFQVYGEHIGATMAATSRHLETAIGRSQAVMIGSNTMVGAVEREVTRQATELAAAEGIPVLFDPNFRPSRWDRAETAVGFCRKLCAVSAVIKCNRAEARLITGFDDPVEAVRSLAAIGPRLAVVTDGAGPVLTAGAIETEYLPAPTEVISPLGAGDAFMGALAAGLTRTGWDFRRVDEVLEAAAGYAATICARRGAQG